MSDEVVVVLRNEVLTVVKNENGLTLKSPGVQGPMGPQGVPGAAGGTVVSLDQSTPASTWIINHNLNRPVFVTVLNSAGEQVFADVDQSDPNTVSIIFATPVSGKAVVS